MGVPEVIGSDIPNLMKDVSNLMKDVPNFVKNVPRVRKYVLWWGSAPNHFLMGSKMKSWTIHVQMGNPKTIKGCTKFCEGCTKGSKVHSKVGIDPQSLPYGLLNEIMDHPYSDEGPENNWMYQI